MSNRPAKHALLITTTEKDKYLDVYVSFDDGKGPGYDDGKVHRKGYVLHVQPIHRVTEGGYTTTKMTGWTGMKGFIEPTTRYSDKRHGELAAYALNTDLCRRLVANVLEMNEGLRIAEGQPLADLNPAAA